MWSWMLGLAFATPPTVPRPAATITVATLNTWGLPAPVAQDRRGRLPLIASWLAERAYDVAGLEEVWQGARQWFLLTNLLFPEPPGDSGLAIATSWPVTRTVSQAFDAERGFDRWKAKGLLAAEVVIDGAPVLLGVTHLQAGGGARNAMVRAFQIEEVLATLEAAAREVPVVLLGDFNLYESLGIDDRSRAAIEEAGFVDAASATGTLDATFPGRPDRFDRIYVRPSATTAVVPERSDVVEKGFSDHHAVEATLRLESR